MLEAIFFGHKEIQRLVDFQQEIVNHIQPEKKAFVPVEKDESLIEQVKQLTEANGLKDTVLTFDKQQRDINLDALKEKVASEFIDEADPENETLIKEVYSILNDLVKEEVRRLIADEKFAQMVVKRMKLDRLILRLVYCQERTVQVYLQEVKLKRYLSLH